MLRFQCSSRVRLVFLSLIFLSLQNIYAQGNEKLYKLSCPEKSDFFIQAPDSAGMKMMFQAHMLFLHNKKLTSADFQSMLNMQKEAVIPAPELRAISCPKGDTFEIRTNDEKELVFWMGTHMIIAHNENMSDEELKKLIK